jgi:hypothetical protein
MAYKNTRRDKCYEQSVLVCDYAPNTRGGLHQSVCVSNTSGFSGKVICRIMGCTVYPSPRPVSINQPPIIFASKPKSPVDDAWIFVRSEVLAAVE